MTTTPEATKQVPMIVGDPAPTLRADHNALGTYIIAELESSVANAAALPATNNWNGRQRYQEDIDTLVVYEGGSWKPAAPAVTPGLSIVKPTSATNGTVQTLGRVTFSAVASVSLNGCFSATYDRYKIIWDAVGSTTTEVNFRIRDNTTDVTGAAAYQRVHQLMSSVTPSYGYTSAAFIFAGGTRASGSGGSFDLISPFLTQRTELVNGSSANAGEFWTTWGEVLDVLSHNGFTLYPTTGTFSGTATVYGYMKG